MAKHIDIQTFELSESQMQHSKPDTQKQKTQTETNLGIPILQALINQKISKNTKYGPNLHNNTCLQAKKTQTDRKTQTWQTNKNKKKQFTQQYGSIIKTLNHKQKKHRQKHKHKNVYNWEHKKAFTQIISQQIYTYSHLELALKQTNRPIQKHF